VNSKGQLCGEKIPGTAVFVKGPSLWWSVSPGTNFYNKEVVEWFVNEMQIGVIRAPMAIRYFGGEGTEQVSNGYYSSPTGQKAIMKRMIDAAVENDIYIIIDWHSHVAHNETALATEFFGEMATEYKNVPNIIWEIYNEPINAGASAITTYANSVINAIRNAGNNNLILVGSNSYSKEPYQQAQSLYGNSATAESKNVAFTFHFYAVTHPYNTNEGIGKSANDAMSNGYAVFGSEWGSMNANGDGQVNSGATSPWTTFMDNSKVSNCAWSASAVNETASMFKSGTTTATLDINNLSANGDLFKGYMAAANKKWIDQVPSTHPKGNDVTKTVTDGQSITISTDLGLDGTITEVSQPETGSASYTGSSVTFTTSSRGSDAEITRFTYKITKNNVTVQRRVTIKITNRRPIVPEREPIEVSRKVPTTFTIMGVLSATDPNDNGVSFTAATLGNPSHGSIEFTGSSIVFNPSPSLANAAFTEVAINYTVKAGGGLTTSATDILHVKNFAPTVNSPSNTYCCLSTQPNTDPIGIGMAQVRGNDKDGDPLQFVKLHLDPWYPGTLTQVKPDSFVYYPDPNKTGKVVFLAVVTDGTDESNLGKSYLILSGNGQDIGNHPDGANGPTEIPGHAPIISQPGPSARGLSVRALGSGRIALSFGTSGFAKLDVYSLSGKNIGTLLNGHQSAGSSEVSLTSLNLQKGVYILRLKQGAQVKTLRIVN
jgi:hypothetical protein